MNKYFLAILCCLALFAPVPASAAWAVATGLNGLPYVNREASSEQRARNGALDACRSETRKCKIVASGDGTCVAMAIAGSSWGIAPGPTKKNRPRGGAPGLHGAERGRVQSRA